MRGSKKLSVIATLEGADGKHAMIVRKQFRVPDMNMKRFMLRDPYSWDARPQYGFVLRTLNPQLAEYFGAPDGKGVLIEKVLEKSDAEKAGFRAGDVIVRAGKKTIHTTKDFTHVLGAFDEGEKIPVKILRKDKEMTLDLTAREQKHHETMDLMDHFDNGMSAGALPLIMKRLMLHPHDVDVNVNTDELENGIRRLEIHLDGKNKELEHMQDELDDMQDELEDVNGKIEVIIDGRHVDVEDLESRIDQMLQNSDDMDVDVDVEGDHVIIKAVKQVTQPRKDT
jgi:hypothetical protein